MRLKQATDAARRFWQRIQQENLGLYAAQASFFLIISFVPLLMLLITLLQFVLPISEAELTMALAEYLPESMQGFFNTIIHELFTNQTVSIISASSLFLLWAASRGVHSVTQGLRHIFRSPSAIYYKERLRSLFYTVAFLLTVLFALVVLVFGNALWSLLSRAFPFLAGAGGLVTLLKYLVAALLITLFALLLYCATAQSPLSRPSAQFAGALFTAAGWILFSTGFSLYISTFANYSFLYGSLTALILLMLWLYICMWLLFLGAKINCMLDSRRKERLQISLHTNENP